MGGSRPLRPSPGSGLRLATRMWRLVVAVWVVSLVEVLPASWVAEGAVAGALGQLPTAGPPPGDVLLILIDGWSEVAAPFRLALLSGLAISWMWTVLWHAGVVNWTLWAGSRRVRMGEVLGLGVVSWWRYARLSATAVAASLVILGSLWWPVSTAVSAAWRGMDELRVIWLLAAGLIVSFLLGLTFWATTARAAWLLGVPGRRSVVVAWSRALADTLRTPVPSLGVVMLWAAPAAALSLLPLVVGAIVPATRAGWLIPALGQLAAAGRAFCWVGLFTSFAPVTELVGSADGEQQRDGYGTG